MHNLKQGPLKFDGYSVRSTTNSIYRREISLDPHDFYKVERGRIKTTKNTGKSVNITFKKSTKRDITKMYKGTEQYANIQRENEKADYIKNLLMNA